MLINAKKGASQLVIIFLAAAILFLGYVAWRSSLETKDGGIPIPVETSDIKVNYPKPNQEVGSPLEISGQARGSWFFEAVFPVKLESADGSELAWGQAHASGNWMTGDFVMFDATLNFSVAEKQNATLVFQNDNPSGLPENSKEFRIPVVLLPTGLGETNFTKTGNLIQSNLGEGAWSLSYEEAGSPGLTVELAFGDNSICKTGTESAACVLADFKAGQRVQIDGQKIGTMVVVSTLSAQGADADHKEVYLYYYDPSRDKDASGNVLCSRKGLVAVKREISTTLTPIQDAINLLIEGKLTAAEKQQGITTGYPLAGLSLKGAALNNGILTLEFSDPGNLTGGGSCRAGILWFQIEATAKQFEGVNEARFMPETLFQP